MNATQATAVRDIVNLARHQIAAHGIARPHIRRFDLDALDALVIGADSVVQSTARLEAVERAIVDTAQDLANEILRAEAIEARAKELDEALGRLAHGLANAADELATVARERDELRAQVEALTAPPNKELEAVSIEMAIDRPKSSVPPQLQVQAEAPKPAGKKSKA